MFLAQKPNIGLTLGKFMPPHMGHELMIDFAYRNSDFLYVLVTQHVEDPYSQNIKWLRELAALRGWERIKFVPQHDPFFGMSKMDENGTIIDQSYWDWWLKDTRQLIGSKIDAVFTSDLYGERIAREFGATWYPVDPNREMYDISATRIRSNPTKHFLDIIEPARPSFCKTIAIVGAEATGKTTLTKRLGKSFGSEIALEYGRTINEIRPELSLQDFQTIVNGQKSLIESAKRRSRNGIIFTDTEEITTYLYLKHFPETLPLVKEKGPRLVETIDPIADLYIVLAINRRTIHDGSRFLDETQRKEHQTELLRILDNKEVPFAVFIEADYEKRFDDIHEYVKTWLDNT